MLKADYRPPLDWHGLLTLRQARATPLERVDSDRYYRQVDGSTVVISNVPAKNQLHIQVPIELSRQAHTILRKTRHLFDLDANPLIIQTVLAEDPFLRELVQRHPGLRVPGAWDKFELVLRIIIGQQISVAGATTLMNRLAERIGVTHRAIGQSCPAAIGAIGLPAKRAATIFEVARRVRAGRLDLEERNPETFYNQLVAVPGIGPWTAEYLKLRVLHWPDAFLASDLGVQKALDAEGHRLSEKQRFERSALWRPWRSYATMLLWKARANQGG